MGAQNQKGWSHQRPGTHLLRPWGLGLLLSVLFCPPPSPEVSPPYTVWVYRCSESHFQIPRSTWAQFGQESTPKLVSCGRGRGGGEGSLSEEEGRPRGRRSLWGRQIFQVCLPQLFIFYMWPVHLFLFLSTLICSFVYPVSPPRWKFPETRNMSCPHLWANRLRLTMCCILWGFQ